MTFTNSAKLLYNGAEVVSNVVTGEFSPNLSFTKTASLQSYYGNTVLQYSVTVVNTSTDSYTGLTVSDNLGQYDFDGASRFPLSYIDNTATLNLYSASGVTVGSLTVSSSGNGVLFTFDLPAQTVAVINYNVSVTVFAPLSVGSSIDNTATLDGNAVVLPQYAENTLPVEDASNLIITKCGDMTAVSGQEFTYHFIVSNYGNLPVTDTDYVVVSDDISPPLTNVTVYANGVLWTNGVQYDYNESAAYFRTQPGALNIAAATFTRDSFGRWNTSPSSVVITLTGTVQ